MIYHEEELVYKKYFKEERKIKKVKESIKNNKKIELSKEIKKDARYN